MGNENTEWNTRRPEAVHGAGTGNGEGTGTNTSMQTFWHRDIETNTHGDAGDMKTETWKRGRHGDGERHEDAES